MRIFASATSSSVIPRGADRQRIALAAQGSVQETVSFGDFGSILILVSTNERQQSVSRVLNAGGDEIALLDAEIVAPIQYEIVRRPRKTLEIAVEPDASVVIAARRTRRRRP
jgi:hypothetical protein